LQFAIPDLQFAIASLQAANHCKFQSRNCKLQIDDAVAADQAAFRHIRACSIEFVGQFAICNS
jgi:hypothetical protein